MTGTSGLSKSAMRAMMEASLPTQEQLAEFEAQQVQVAKANPSSIVNWLPAVESSQINSPKTQVIDFPVSLTKGMVDGKVGDPEQHLLSQICDQIRSFGKQYGYPLFLKNSLFSAKHEWENTCCIESEQTDLVAHIFNITEAWAFFGQELALHLVVREMIPTSPAFHALPGSMPINAEFRAFARDGQMYGWQPYWPAHSIHCCDDPQWPKKLREISCPTAMEFAQMTEAAAEVTKKLGGDWSVDFLRAKDGTLWLIDMAEAHKSYKCEKGYRTMSHHSLEGDRLTHQTADPDGYTP